MKQQTHPRRCRHWGVFLQTFQAKAALLAAFLLLLGSLHGSRAQTTNTWNGSKDTNWIGGNSRQNWSQGNPSGGQLLVFAGTTNTTNNNNTTANTSYAGIIFAANAGAFSLNGNVITLAGDIANYSAFNQAINLSLILGTNVTFNAASNKLTIAGSSRISGSFSLTKSGSGTLVLANSNSYSGGTIVNAGSILIQNTNALGSGGVSLTSNSLLRYDGASGIITNAFQITSGTGILANSGGGTLTLAGTIIHNGTTLGFQGGSYNVTGAITGSATNSDLYLSNAAVLLSNAGNDYNGATRIYAGSTLTLGLSKSLPSRSTVTIGGIGETPGISNKINLNGHSLTISSLQSGTGAQNQIVNSAGISAMLTLAGASVFGGAISGPDISLTAAPGSGNSVTLGGANTYNGSTTVSGGTLSLGTTGSLTSKSMTVTGGSTLLLGANNQLAGDTALSLFGTLSLGGGGTHSSQTFASVTLTGNSTIDFGALGDTSSVSLRSLQLNNNTLYVLNWNGTTLWGATSSTGGVGALTSLFTSSSLTQSDLSMIHFYSGGSTSSGFMGSAFLSGNQIVPVPEPSVMATAAILLLGLLGAVARNPLPCRIPLPYPPSRR